MKLHEQLGGHKSTAGTDGGTVTTAGAGAMPGGSGGCRGARPSPGFLQPSPEKVLKAHPAPAGEQRLAQGDPRARHGQCREGLGWAAGAAAEPGCGAGAPRDPPAARDSSEVTRGSAEGTAKELLSTAAPKKRFGVPGGTGV